MERLRGDGFEIRPGKTLAFRWPGQERFIRLCSLGKGYDESELRAALRGDARENPFRSWASKQKAPEKLSLLIDIQEKLKAGKGPDYGDPSSKNMLIHGDNLIALEALQQDFGGEIKCIYIDIILQSLIQFNFPFDILPLAG